MSAPVALLFTDLVDSTELPQLVGDERAQRLFQAHLEAGDQRPESGQGLPILDASAKAAYQQRLRELRDELEEAERFHDPGRADRARDEMDALTEQLAAAVGLGGRDRQAASSSERARSVVTKAIKAALNRIGDHHAALGRHLTMSVKTGTFCSYAPDEPPAPWAF